MKKRICVITIICVVALPYIFPFFSPWSRINCTEHDVDIETGRLRVSSFFYWIRTNKDYRETLISSELYAGSLDKPEGSWVRVNTFGPCQKNSPNHGYHSATSQMNQLQYVWSEHDSDKESRETHARRILDLWKLHGNDNAVDEYIQQIYEGQ